jgi:murein DD-endopeptidase MepM/ murein hydrolase activator NlpD
MRVRSESGVRVLSTGPRLAALLLSFVAAISGSSARAQQCTVKPAAIPLGQTVRLRCELPDAARDEVSDKVPAVTARLDSRLNGSPNRRTVRLFKQESGDWEGLMPVAVEDSPGTYPLEFLGPDGATLALVNLTIRKTIFPTQNVVLAPQIEALHTTTEERQTLTTFRDSVSDVKYWDDPLVAPLPGCVISPFGVARLHNGKPTGEIHAGIDQRAAAGTPIRAAAAGVVKIVQPFNVLGGTVAIDHGQGLETMYLHMSKLSLELGAQVKKGDVIGYVGATGRANGPHLHWVVYVNGVPQNPQQWVTLKSCLTSPKKSKR